MQSLRSLGPYLRDLFTLNSPMSFTSLSQNSIPAPSFNLTTHSGKSLYKKVCKFCSNSNLTTVLAGNKRTILAGILFIALIATRIWRKGDNKKTEQRKPAPYRPVKPKSYDPTQMNSNKSQPYIPTSGAGGVAISPGTYSGDRGIRLNASAPPPALDDGSEPGLAISPNANSPHVDQRRPQLNGQRNSFPLHSVAHHRGVEQPFGAASVQSRNNAIVAPDSLVIIPQISLQGLDNCGMASDLFPPIPYVELDISRKPIFQLSRNHRDGITSYEFT